MVLKNCGNNLKHKVHINFFFFSIFINLRLLHFEEMFLHSWAFLEEGWSLFCNLGWRGGRTIFFFFFWRWGWTYFIGILHKHLMDLEPIPPLHPSLWEETPFELKPISKINFHFVYNSFIYSKLHVWKLQTWRKDNIGIFTARSWNTLWKLET